VIGNHTSLTTSNKHEIFFLFQRSYPSAFNVFNAAAFKGASSHLTSDGGEMW